MKFIIGFLLLFAGLKAIGSVPIVSLKVHGYLNLWQMRENITCPE